MADPISRVIAAGRRMMAADTSQVFVAQLVSKAVSFAVFAIISKGLPRELYAQFVLLFAFLTIITEVGGVALLQSVVRYAAERRGDKAQHGSVAFTALVSGSMAGCLLAMIVMALSKAGLVPAAVHGNITPVIIYVTAMVVYSSVNAALNGLGEYQSYLKSCLATSIGLLLTTIVVQHVYGLRVETVISIYAISAILPLAVQGMLLAKMRPGRINLGFYRYIITFGSWYLLWSMFSVIESKVDVFIISAFSVQRDVAVYDISLRYLQIIQMVTTTISTVALPRLVACNDDRALLSKARQSLKKTLLWAGLLNLFLIPIVIMFVALYYDGKYDDIAYIYPLHAVAMLFFIGNIPLSVEVYRLGKVHLFFFVSVIVLVVKLPLSYYLTGRFGIIGSATSFMVSQFLCFAFFLVATRKIAKRQSSAD